MILIHSCQSKYNDVFRPFIFNVIDMLWLSFYFLFSVCSFFLFFTFPAFLLIIHTFFEFHIDLPIMFLSVSFYIAYLLVALGITLYIYLNYIYLYMIYNIYSVCITYLSILVLSFYQFKWSAETLSPFMSLYLLHLKVQLS